MVRPVERNFGPGDKKYERVPFERNSRDEDQLKKIFAKFDLFITELIEGETKKRSSPVLDYSYFRKGFLVKSKLKKGHRFYLSLVLGELNIKIV